jgi:hypothetical protein
VWGFGEMIWKWLMRSLDNLMLISVGVRGFVLVLMLEDTHRCSGLCITPH